MMNFLPNTDPARYHLASATAIPRPVANSMTNTTTAVPANTDQDYGSGTQGQINVNTADWKTLSMLPLVVNNSAAALPRLAVSMSRPELYPQRMMPSPNRSFTVIRDVDDSGTQRMPNARHIRTGLSRAFLN